MARYRWLGRLTGRKRKRVITKMIGFVVVQYCSWSLAVKGYVLSAYCLFVCFFKVGTLQVHVHVGTGIQMSVHSCITVLTFCSFSFFLFVSLSLFSGFVLPRHSFARPTTTTTTTEIQSRCSKRPTSILVVSTYTLGEYKNKWTRKKEERRRASQIRQPQASQSF